MGMILSPKRRTMIWILNGHMESHECLECFLSAGGFSTFDSVKSLNHYIEKEMISISLEFYSLSIVSQGILVSSRCRTARFKFSAHGVEI